MDNIWKTMDILHLCTTEHKEGEILALGMEKTFDILKLYVPPTSTNGIRRKLS